MDIHILTLFPEYFSGPLGTGLLGKALEDDLAKLVIHNLRSWTHDRHGTADDYPFGGGPGMVLKPEPFFEAYDQLLAEGLDRSCPVILTTPQGRLFDREAALELSEESQLLILCGRYRGVDERVRDALVTQEYSVGDVILNGGEAAALVMVEAIVRLLPGAMGDPESAAGDSFASGLLDCPHYTRPSVYRDMAVPEVLLSGDHAAVERWRQEQALRITLERRPELLERVQLSEADRKFLEEI
jgi:tRNA (guanine37-N1)-methyltransferase